MSADKFIELFLSALFLPILQTFVNFAWGTDADPTWIIVVKRVFILLPILAMILGYWTSVVSILSIPFRAERINFVNALFVTWWDFGRAVLNFWGGVFKFAFYALVGVLSFIRLAVVGVWVLIQDIVLIPFRVIGNLGENVLNPGIPWLAVGLTVFWCTFEALIFTHVTTSLVLDTLSNMTGNQMTEGMIKIPLFLFMLFIVLGSYAVLSTWTDALKAKKIGQIIKIGAIELVALFVEVVFLYREFVDALVPWFAQHSSGKFELGIFGTLAIASCTWFGIRSISWFLFAAHGTPTIMAVIQGSGLQRRSGASSGKPLRGTLGITMGILDQIKKESEWAKRQGEELLGAFILPPLQVVGAAINFCTLLLSTRHLFDLPFKHLVDLKEAKVLMERRSGEGSFRKAS